MTWLFSATILLGSCLLFLVQPMCAKKLLPHLGGTPAVWTTCMVFFQAGLLLGYAVAHFLPRWLGIKGSSVLYVVALALTFLFLPIQFPDEIEPDRHPILWLLMTLTLNVGLPFVLLAAAAPLLQRLYADENVHRQSTTLQDRRPVRDPYFLYAASNLGSFIGLGLFPFVVEPFWSMTYLSAAWRYGGLVLAMVMFFCLPPHTVFALPSPPQTLPPGGWLRARWIVLAMIPSSLLLSVTTYATTDIAAIPLLWLIPMAIYLLTFILAFAGKPLIPRVLLLRWLPLVVLVVVILLLCERPDPMLLVLVLHLFGFFWLAMVCHGELSRTRPVFDHLTTFYLCLAIGGVLGGILNALVAPFVFLELTEYPLMIVLACCVAHETVGRPTLADAKWVLGIGGLSVLLVFAFQSRWFGVPAWPLSVAAMFGVPLILCYTTQAAPTRFAMCMAVVLLASWFNHGVHGPSAYRERSWFGIHRVTSIKGFTRLVHGNTVHGQQDETRRDEPLVYYGKEGPAGDIFQSLADDPRLQHVGVVGLGAGSLAAYARQGQAWTFFEIDPSVERIAENSKLFTFITDARKRKTDIVIDVGDARLRLKKSAQKFGVLVVDAFGSDAIPMHLLTREAMQIYLDRLEPTGVLAFHISNRYVDLEPVLANLALDAQPPLVCRINDRRKLSADAAKEGVWVSVWVIIARNEADLAPILERPSWQPARPRPELKAWTDDSSNLLRVFRFGG